ncbi:unnamed protein product [Allacma fusca]|uniref:Uncharacterized protein n=1 Tax=Allacma fusca TaxID=39272 RepID=A0A8J2JD36_9HEXA|nr:unnamed protein product [Allacma fusca]
MKSFLWNFLNIFGLQFGFYLISLNLFVRIQGSSRNPTISYCTSDTDSLWILRECPFTIISNSTFAFGKIDQNVVQLISEIDPAFVFIKCEASYPIRWLASKPLGTQPLPASIFPVALTKFVETCLSSIMVPEDLIIVMGM